MTTTDLPPRRGLYFLNPTPPPVLTQAQLAAMDADPEGIELVRAIINVVNDRNNAKETK